MTTTHHEAGQTTWLSLPDAPPIPGLRFRRMRRTDADYAAIAGVFAASNLADDIPYTPSGANLREEFEDQAGFDPDVDFIVAEVDGVQVADAGIDRVQRGSSVVYEVWGHVDPAWRRRGIGRALLAANIARGRERAAADVVVDPRPAFAGSFSHESEVGHRRLVADAGFDIVRYFFDMRRDLTSGEVAAAPLPRGLELRPVTPDQHRAIWEADVEAFRDHWEARQPEESDFATLFARADYDPSLWVVAWDGDEVAGSVQAWIWKDENATQGVCRAWLEHISVRRPWRGRGLARALIGEALRRVRAAGMDEAMLGVDAANPTGALGLYESMGFTVSARSAAGRLLLR